jgi:hypothetical protein
VIPDEIRYGTGFERRLTSMDFNENEEPIGEFLSQRARLEGEYRDGLE